MRSSIGKRSPLSWALDYAKHGWAVLPLYSINAARTHCTCGNTIESEKCSAGKHPRTKHGFQDATTDPEEIRRWWEQWPDANIGLATGEPSGVWVLDIDPRNGGDETLDAEFPGLEAAVESLTGGGGRHLFWSDPWGVPSSGSRGVLPGVDVKSDGGYVVLPPSNHKSGGRYEWEVEHHPEDQEPGEAPPELLARVRTKPKTMKAAETVGKIIEAGGRNNALTSLAGSMRRRGMTPNAIRDALRTTNREQCRPPLPSEEVEGIARSVGSYEPEQGSLTGFQLPEKDSQRRREYSDLGNCYRLVDRHGMDLRFAGGLWYIWDGVRWAKDITGEVTRRAKDSCQLLYAEVAAVADSVAAGGGDEYAKMAEEAAQKHARRSQQTPRIKAMIELAKSEFPVALDGAKFDSDPWLLNVQNGTLDLKTGLLREHRRADHLTHVAAAAFEPEAKAERWEQFLLETFGADLAGAATIEFIQRLLGYALVGAVLEHVLPIFWGHGANGKTTLVGAVQGVLGRGYAIEAPPDLLVHNPSGSRHPAELATLKGCRLVTAGELPDGRLDERRVKTLNGGDAITAAHKFGNYFTFAPSHTLIASTNHKPQTRGTDLGLWRRLLLVPFTRTVEPEDQDQELPRKLAEEGPGILRWLVTGCMEWQRIGLAPPDSVRAATEDYRDSMDRVGEFIREACETGGEVEATASELYSAFVRWCEEHHEKPWGRRRFGESLGEKGYKRLRPGWANGRFVWHGLRPVLRTEEAYG